MIMIIEDDLLMANCVKKACRKQKEKAEVLIFTNAIEAMEKLDFRNLPELIFFRYSAGWTKWFYFFE